MATHLAANRPLTVEEYLEFEGDSPVRHEFVAGYIHAMSGATKRHNRIAGNISALLWIAARGRPCRVYALDVKLRAASNIIYYPDVMTACGPEDDDPLVENDPCLVVEVLSPSTQVTDRREKLMFYRQMPKLRAYLIVHQESRLVERHWREDDGNWRHAELAERGEIAVPCPDTRLSLEQIYEEISVR